jgi:predicted naringenin-chalcone synthase
MRYLHQFFEAPLGTRWTNQELLAEYEGFLAALSLAPEELDKLREFVRFQLVGERARRTSIRDWRTLTDFASRASAFESGIDQAIELLASQIGRAAAEAGITFDGVLTTTSTGSVMPGISYRLAHRLQDVIRPDSMMIDLAHVGCTGGLKLMSLARSLDPALKNLLLVSVEVPTTLVETTATAADIWQGNCTFGDGCAAMWVSSDAEQGPAAFSLEEIRSWQRADTGLDLIRWGYRSYYHFALRNEKEFDKDVRQYVVDALNETQGGWKDEPRWAVHPAGIALLVRISRRLGIAGESIQPSIAHYRENCNMSSASILQILANHAAETPPGEAINMLSMGAGFKVVYGRVRRTR